MIPLGAAKFCTRPSASSGPANPRSACWIITTPKHSIPFYFLFIAAPPIASCFAQRAPARSNCAPRASGLRHRALRLTESSICCSTQMPKTRCQAFLESPILSPAGSDGLVLICSNKTNDVSFISFTEEPTNGWRLRWRAGRRRLRRTQGCNTSANHATRTKTASGRANQAEEERAEC